MDNPKFEAIIRSIEANESQMRINGVRPAVMVTATRTLTGEEVAFLANDPKRFSVGDRIQVAIEKE